MARRRSYPPEFRQQMVELVRAGRTPRELASEFTVSEQAIRSWVKQTDVDAGKRADGLTTQENEEIQRLRREVKQLRTEREILAKAAAWLNGGFRRAPLGRPTQCPEIFGFVRAHQAEYPIATVCRVLEVSASGYYEC